MSKRLEVLFYPIGTWRMARREQLTVGAWVRRALREARKRESAADPEIKLRAIRPGAEFSFPDR